MEGYWIRTFLSSAMDGLALLSCSATLLERGSRDIIGTCADTSEGQNWTKEVKGGGGEVKAFRPL